MYSAASTLVERAAVPREKVKTQSQVLQRKIAIVLSVVEPVNAHSSARKIDDEAASLERKAESALPHNLMNAI